MTRRSIGRARCRPLPCAVAIIGLTFSSSCARILGADFDGLGDDAADASVEAGGASAAGGAAATNAGGSGGSGGAHSGGEGGLGGTAAAAGGAPAGGGAGMPAGGRGGSGGSVVDGGAGGPTDAATDAPSLPFEPAPLAYYSFDAADVVGTTAVDSSGARDGTIFGATAAQGIAGDALNFDGIDDYVRLEPFDDIAGALSISAWAWIESVPFHPANPGIVDKWDWPGSKRSFALSFNSQRFAAFVSQRGDLADVTVLADTTPAPLVRWEHAALTYDGTTLRLYRNGMRIDGASPYATPGPPFISNDVDAWIGRSRMDASPEQVFSWFHGRIDEVAIWNRALSDSDVLAVHARGAAGRRLD